MLMFEATGDSHNSPAEALSAAVANAVSTWNGAAHKNVFVHCLNKTSDGGWHVSLDVFVQPRQELENLEHDEQQRNLEKAKQDFDQAEVTQHLQAHHLIYELDTEKAYNMQRQRRLEQEEDYFEFVIFYVELCHEDVFREIQPQFNFEPSVQYAVHYMPKSLIEAEKKHLLDISMHKAAHDEYRGEKPESPLLSPKPERKKRVDHAPRLAKG